MDANTKPFVWDGDEDGELIDMAFSKKKVDDRKRWLRAFKPGTFLDHSVAQVRYEDFINRELILFSIADLQRSIPSVMDGLKPSQRKVLFACFKRKLRADIKVAQLSGYVSEHSAYHHGEASLASTIVGLAQDFVGANNVNLLVPSGQFGTRLQGGKDHASPRYIFTRLAPLARALFPEADDALLNYLHDDGQRIEPDYYLPILPLLLVNGADGIGTGWSTSVPNYSPRDIVTNLKRMLDGEAPEKMHPWYRGFGGEIVSAPDAKAGERAYLVSGIVRVLDDTTLEVTELPLQSWTQDYKDFLEGMRAPEKKEETPFITEYKEYHTDTTVRFIITLPAANLVAAIEAGLEKKFKLTGRVATSNMHAFDADGRITKYESPEAILQTFFSPRLEAYSRRKEQLLSVAAAELVRLQNRMRFILDVVEGRLVIAKRKRAELEAELRKRGYDALGGRGGAAAASSTPAEEEEAADAEASAAVAGGSYDYLLSQPLWSLTLERVAQLKGEHEAKEEEVVRLRGTSPSALWRDDLDAFLVAYEAAEAASASEDALLSRQQSSFEAGRAAGGGRKPAAKKASRCASDEEDDFEEDGESDSDDYGKKKKAKPKAKPAAKAAASKPAPTTVAVPCAAADLYAAAKAKALPFPPISACARSLLPPISGARAAGCAAGRAAQGAARRQDGAWRGHRACWRTGGDGFGRRGDQPQAGKEAARQARGGCRRRAARQGRGQAQEGQARERERVGDRQRGERQRRAGDVARAAPGAARRRRRRRAGGGRGGAQARGAAARGGGQERLRGPLRLGGRGGARARAQAARRRQEGQGDRHQRRRGVGRGAVRQRRLPLPPSQEEGGRQAQGARRRRRRRRARRRAQARAGQEAGGRGGRVWPHARAKEGARGPAGRRRIGQRRAGGQARGSGGGAPGPRGGQEARLRGQRVGGGGGGGLRLRL